LSGIESATISEADRPIKRGSDMLDWNKALSVWWSIFWRSFLYGALLGFVFGFIGGVIAALMHHPENAAIYGMIGGYIASIPASMLAVKQGVEKHLQSLVAAATKPPPTSSMPA
jgi:hypothetical protein